MRSGDGVIVRLRPRLGKFTCEELAAIADLAERFGNGQIDLTRRANLQMRGLAEEALPAVWKSLREMGLLDESEEAEAVRNLMIDPLSGVDAEAGTDLRSIARAVEAGLTSDRRFWKLPGKFGFVIDGGVWLPLDDVRADIRLRAARDNAAGIALGLDRPDGVFWVGQTGAERAADVALATASAFLDVSPDPRLRMRDLPVSQFAELRSRIGAMLEPVAITSPRDLPVPALGVLRHRRRAVAVGVAAPFGRLGAPALREFADAAVAAGALSVRLSPWRALYVPVAGDDAATKLVSAAGANGFVLDANDPLLRIEACPGAAGCRSSQVDTHAAARHLAGMLKAIGCSSGHVSGCSKGCASSRPADVVLVGAGDQFGVLRHATPNTQPRAYLSPDRLSELPTVLATL
jgi:precorrin-3B synthase